MRPLQVGRERDPPAEGSAFRCSSLEIVVFARPSRALCEFDGEFAASREMNREFLVFPGECGKTSENLPVIVLSYAKFPCWPEQGIIPAEQGGFCGRRRLLELSGPAPRSRRARDGAAGRKGAWESR
jgi:hypothetical protein